MVKFILKIALGNEAMQNTTDVISALSTVITNLHRDHENKIICTHKGLSGKISDLNGNTVGSWQVK